jgi:hypothetical protein
MRRFSSAAKRASRELNKNPENPVARKTRLPERPVDLSQGKFPKI